MRLQLEIEGGSSTDEPRAIDAAKAVFAAARISSEQAADGMSAVEKWGDAGCHDDQAPVQDEDMDGCQQGGDRVVGLMSDCDPPSQKELKLIVVVAFDRGLDRELFTGYGPTDQQSEERVIRIAKALASKHCRRDCLKPRADPALGDYGPQPSSSSPMSDMEEAPVTSFCAAQPTDRGRPNKTATGNCRLPAELARQEPVPSKYRWGRV